MICWPDCRCLVLVEEGLHFRKSKLFQRLVAGPVLGQLVPGALQAEPILCTPQSPLCQEVPKYLASFD